MLSLNCLCAQARDVSCWFHQFSESFVFSFAMLLQLSDNWSIENSEVSKSSFLNVRKITEVYLFSLSDAKQIKTSSLPSLFHSRDGNWEKQFPKKRVCRVSRFTPVNFPLSWLSYENFPCYRNTSPFRPSQVLNYLQLCQLPLICYARETQSIESFVFFAQFYLKKNI